MLKTLLAQVREFKKASFLTPFFMILEVLFETLIPLAMASIIDKGVEAGNIGHIYRMGAVMVALALCGLWSGVMGGKYGALASTGFARNLRKAMYTNIQTFSFSNIDKYPQNSSIMLSPCFLNPMYISPAPGIREKINTQKPCFCFFINLLASVYNFIRKIVQIITDLLRMFTELGTYLHGKLV